MITPLFEIPWIQAAGGNTVFIPASIPAWNESLHKASLLASLTPGLDDAWASPHTEWDTFKNQARYGLTDYWDTGKSQSELSVIERGSFQYVVFGGNWPRPTSWFLKDDKVHVVRLWGGYDNPDFNSVKAGMLRLEGGTASLSKIGPSLPVILLDEEYLLMDAGVWGKGLSLAFNPSLPEQESWVFKCKPGKGPHLIKTYLCQFDEYASFLVHIFEPQA